MSKIIGVHIPDGIKNYIINGDMRIAQRALSIASVAGGAYTLDRYVYGKTTSNTHTVSQDTDVPSFAQSGYAYQNSLRMNLTGADTSIAAGDFNWIMQKIEGYNWANLAQKQFTLSFWVKATLPGVYCVAFQNGATDRSYVAEYTILASNSWEYKVITVAASPSAGTWNYTNGEGLRIAFTVACGSTFQTSAGSWQAGNFYGTPNQVNGINTGATDFRLTGIMINEGTLAFPFQLFGEDRESEIAACQRYYQKTYGIAVPVGTTADASGIESKVVPANAIPDQQRYGGTKLAVQMRTAPSMGFFGLNGAANAVSSAIGADFGNGSGTAQFINENSFNTYNNSGGTLNTTVFNIIYHWAANAEL